MYLYMWLCIVNISYISKYLKFNKKYCVILYKYLKINKYSLMKIKEKNYKKVKIFFFFIELK